MKDEIIEALLEEGLPTDLSDFEIKLKTAYPLDDDGNKTRVLKIKGKTEQFSSGQIRLIELKISYKDYHGNERKPFRRHTAIIK